MKILLVSTSSNSLNQSERRLLDLVTRNKSHLVDSRDKRMVNAMNSLEKKRLVDVKHPPLERGGFTFYDVILVDEDSPQFQKELEQSIIAGFVQLGGKADKLKAIHENDRLDAIWTWLFSVKRNPVAVSKMRQQINHLWRIKHNRQLDSVEPTQFIRLAADSIEELRKSDVERVLTAAGSQKVPTAYYIVLKRPDLKEEVVDVMKDLWNIPFHVL